MPNVDISINGRLYPVACDPGQEGRVRELAGIVDSRVRQLVGGVAPGAVGETHVLVLAGLMLADELDETRAAAAQTKPAAPSTGPTANDPAATEEAALLVAAVEHLAERIAGIADRLDRS